MSGFEIVGLITTTIEIIDAIIVIYDGLKDAKALPEAFREVMGRLPLVETTLRIVEKSIRDDVGEEAQAMRTVLEQCKAKAENLKEIFKAVAPPEDSEARFLQKYRSIVKRLGKGNKVEVLGKGMMEDVQALAGNRAVKAATQDQISELQVAIEELSGLSPSLPDDGAVTQNHYGSGHNVAGDNYNGNHNVYQGTGGGPVYFGAVTNNHGTN